MNKYRYSGLDNEIRIGQGGLEGLCWVLGVSTEVLSRECRGKSDLSCFLYYSVTQVLGYSLDFLTQDFL